MAVCVGVYRPVLFLSNYNRQPMPVQESENSIQLPRTAAGGICLIVVNIIIIAKLQIIKA